MPHLSESAPAGDPLELLPDGILLLDADWKVLQVNTAFLQSTGGTRGAMLGRSLWEALPALEQGPVGPLCRKAMSERRTLTTETLDLRLQRSVEVRAVPRPDGGLTVLVREIGADFAPGLPHGQALAPGHTGEARFRALLRSELLGLVESDTEGRIHAANDAFLRIIGRTRAELEAGQLRWNESTPPEWASVDARALERLATLGYGAPFEKEYSRPDGARVPVLLNAEVLAPGRFLVLVLDVSERKRAERNMAFLSESSTLLGASLDYEGATQELARLAVPTLADWCAVDLRQPDGHLRRLGVMHSDPAKLHFARELFERYPPRPDDPSGVSYVARTGKSEWLPDIPDEALAAGAHDAEHLRLARLLGLKSYLCVPLISRGRVLGAFSLVHAESGRRYTEADLRLAEELARRAALFIDNAELYRNAQQAVRLRDEFLSIASHELKTPLTPLNLKLETLARVAAGYSGHPLAERVGKDVETARRQVQRLSDLVNGLLDVSRISAGRMSLQREDVELGELVREVAERFFHDAQRAGCEVEFVVAPGPLVGRWDRVRLEQVVTNLLSNAFKYGPGQPVVVRVGPAAAAGHARLEVQDHGIGISSQDTARIFERFERAVSERHYGGLGLGLYIVRQIVQAHGGEVGVDSSPGAGSRFWVELPLEAEARS
jgi:PAS domain S-box-containing protein